LSHFPSFFTRRVDTTAKMKLKKKKQKQDKNVRPQLISLRSGERGDVLKKK